MSDLLRRCLLGAVLLLMPVVLHAGTEGKLLLPAKLQLAVLTKVWSFDRNFPEKGTVTLLVIYQRRNLTSRRTMEEMVEAASGFPRVTLRILDLEHEPLTADLLRDVDVAYLAPLRAVEVAPLVALTRQAGVRTASGVLEYLSAGVAVGLGVQAARPEISVNLAASRAEGSDFSSQLLKLAKVIR